MADRRRRRETAVGTLPDAASSSAREAPDAVALLDEEIARLSDRYRLPVVLCELEGMNRKDAARQLGIAEGTLSSRLAAARKALADRLRQRGVVLSAAWLAAAFAQTATACPPAALAAKAAAATSPALVPPAVGDLTNGVLRIMFLDKLKAVVLLSRSRLVSFPPGRWREYGGDSTIAKLRFAQSRLLVLVASKTVLMKAEAKPAEGAERVSTEPAPHAGSTRTKNDKKVSENRDLYHSGSDASPDGKQMPPILNLLPPDDGTTPQTTNRTLVG